MRDDEFRYGDSNTIHGSQKLDVEVDGAGKVVAVWFRCRSLPFAQTVANEDRAAALRGSGDATDRIKAIVFDTIP